MLFRAIAAPQTKKDPRTGSEGTWKNSTWDYCQPFNFIPCWCGEKERMWEREREREMQLHVLANVTEVIIFSVTVPFSPKLWTWALLPRPAARWPTICKGQSLPWKQNGLDFKKKNLHLITHSPPQTKYILSIELWKDSRIAARNFTYKNWGYNGGGFLIVSLKLSHFSKQNTLPLQNDLILKLYLYKYLFYKA